MLTVGLAPLGRRRAAAVVRDGTILAVRSDAPVVSLPPGAGHAALLKAVVAAAGVGMAEVDVVAATSTDGASVLEPPPSRLAARLLTDFPRARFERVCPSHALARQAAAAADGSALLLITRPNGLCHLFDFDGTVRYLGPVAGTTALGRAVRRVATAVGVTTIDWLAALSDLADSGPQLPDGAPGGRFAHAAGGSVVVDNAALEMIIDATRAVLPGDLSDAQHPHRSVQLGRRTLAQMALRQFVATVCDVIGFHRQKTGHRRIAAAGDWFSVPAVNSRLRKALGNECSIAPVTGPEGLAVGAALPDDGPRAALSHLAFGPDTTDDAVKQTLDNCRVDYVYEPSMDRLLLRSAALLANGKQVGWCQGPADIGGRSLGSRSVLTDPGNRYARENVNVFLLGRRPDRPLMVSIQEERCAEILELPSHQSRFGEWQGRVRREHSQALGAAVDAEGRCALHTVLPDSPSHLWQLLDACRRHHGIPGLLNVPLGRGDGTLASSPREAVQAFYSSAVDALVVGRFLLMKDYWLLRSDLG